MGTEDNDMNGKDESKERGRRRTEGWAIISSEKGGRNDDEVEENAYLFDEYRP